MPTNAELTQQLTDMTKRATDAETRAEGAAAKLADTEKLAIAKSQECAELRDDVEKLTEELRSATSSLAAYKGSATKARSQVEILRKELSPTPRNLGAMKPAKTEEDAADRAAALEAAFKADTSELVFSDGRREIRDLAPLAVTGDSWRIVPAGLGGAGRVLNAEIDLDPGDCRSETMELKGFALLNEAGEQVGYCPLPDAVIIRRNQRTRLSHNTVRF